MHIPGKMNIIRYKDCNFIEEVDECMCHKEKTTTREVIYSRLLFSTHDVTPWRGMSVVVCSNQWD